MRSLILALVGAWLITTDVVADEYEDSITTYHPDGSKTTSRDDARRQVELEEIRRDCFAYYGRMCRDETEVFFASFRRGLNEGLRGGRDE